MISPSSLVTYGKEITHLTADAAGVWSASAGELFTDPGATLAYDGSSSVDSIYFKAQNKTSSGTISCTGHSNVPVSITGVFPGVPSYPYTWSPAKRGVIVNTKRDGSTNGRILSDGQLRRDYKLVMQNNKLYEYDEVELFWDYHYPNLKFRYADKLRNINANFQFNSPITVTAQSHQRINYEVEIVQVP